MNITSSPVFDGPPYKTSLNWKIKKSKKKNSNTSKRLSKSNFCYQINKKFDALLKCFNMLERIQND